VIAICSVHNFCRVSPRDKIMPNKYEKSLNKECGWKGGDRGGLARWEQYGKRRNKEEERKREKQLIGLTLTGLLMEGVELSSLGRLYK
jgi:hypothetical protein